MFRTYSGRAHLSSVSVAIAALALACGRKEAPPASVESATAASPATAEPQTPAVAAAEPSAAAPAEPATTDTSASAAASVAQPTKRSPVRTPDVIYVPTPQPVVEKMLELAKPKKTDVLYDLGCGDGRIVVTAAKKYGIKAFGFDIDPERVDEARENVRKNGVENLVTIEEKDIFTIDLSPANVVTLYLLPELNVKLIPQLEKLKPGSRVVTHDFDIEGIKPLKQFGFAAGTADENKHEVYLFTIPFQKTKT